MQFVKFETEQIQDSDINFQNFPSPWKMGKHSRTFKTRSSRRGNHVWYCIETNACIVKLFPQLIGYDSSFLALTPLHSSKKNPLSGALNTQGWEKFVIFDRNRCLSPIQYEIGPWLLWNTNRKSQLISVASNDTDWLWKTGQEGSKFSGGFP